MLLFYLKPRLIAILVLNESLIQTCESQYWIFKSAELFNINEYYCSWNTSCWLISFPQSSRLQLIHILWENMFAKWSKIKPFKNKTQLNKVESLRTCWENERTWTIFLNLRFRLFSAQVVLYCEILPPPLLKWEKNHFKRYWLKYLNVSNTQYLFRFSTLT